MPETLTVQSSILGPDGRPLTRALTREIAGASMASVRSIATGHPADGLSPERLAVILRGAEEGDATAFLELAEQCEERYPHYNAVLGVRKRQVAQLPVTVEAAGDDAQSQKEAQLVRDWLKRDLIEAELVDVLDALGKGYSATELVWRTGAAWLPQRLRWRDPRFFEIDRVDGETPYLKDSGGQAEAMGLTPAPNGHANCFRLPPAKFVWHVHAAKSGTVLRGGLARVAAFSFMLQRFALQDWAEFANVYGFPIRVGKYGPGATEEDIRTLLRAVVSVARDAGCVIPNSMEMEFVNAQGQASSEIYDRLASRADDSVSKAVLGQTATTSGTPGKLGGDEAQSEVRADIERADAKLLAATLNRDLLRPMILFNFGNDVPHRTFPQLNIGREESEDIEATLKGVQTFVSMGGRVAASVVRDKLGLPDPLAGEPLLVAPGAAAPAVPALPGGGRFAGQEAPGGPSGTLTPPTPLLTASYRPLRAVSAAGLSPLAALVAAAAGQVVARERDEIDRVAAALVSERGQALLAPLVEPLLDALRRAETPAEAEAAIAAAAAAMDEGALAAALEQACGAALIAGVGGGFDRAA